MSTYRIYIHYKADTLEPFYIGRSCSDYRPKSRTNRNSFWKNTVTKHGFIFRVFGGNYTRGYANKLEQRLIRLYSKKYKLANLTQGGDGCVGFSHSQKAKDAMSKARKGKKHSAEWCKNLSNTQKLRYLNGAIPSATFYTDESRRKLSEAAKLKFNKPNKTSRPVLCETTGEVFDCIVAAARAHGVSDANLGKHLHRKKHYNTIGGKVYRWL